MGGEDFLHVFLISLMDPVSTHYAKNSLIFLKLSLETKMLNHCRIPSLEYSREAWMSSGGLLIYCYMRLPSREYVEAGREC